MFCIFYNVMFSILDSFPILSLALDTDAWFHCVVASTATKSFA
jgi:hypothetical protein